MLKRLSGLDTVVVPGDLNDDPRMEGARNLARRCALPELSFRVRQIENRRKPQLTPDSRC